MHSVLAEAGVPRRLSSATAPGHSRELVSEEHLAHQLGNSPAMRRIYGRLSEIAFHDWPVLIACEPGVGAELLAQRIHQLSPRAVRPFEVVHCGARLPDHIEAELCGPSHEIAVARTDADRGKLAAARGGTLFLDQIDYLPRRVQHVLLRSMRQVDDAHREEGRIRGDAPRFVVAASHNIDLSVRSGLFKPELFYRLDVLHLDIPPLRERPQDVLFLAKRFVEQKANDLGRRPCGISREACEALQAYSWPGNIQELRNVMEHAVWVAAEMIQVVHLGAIGAQWGNEPVRSAVGLTVRPRTGYGGQ